MNPRVPLDPDRPEGPHGTQCVRHGVPVIEVDRDFYLSRDRRYEAVRFCRAEGADFRGWVVRHRLNHHDHSDVIATRPDALRVLGRVAARKGDPHR